MLWWWTHSQGVSRSCCQIAFRVLTGVSLLLEQYWLYLRLVLLFWFHFLSHTLFNIYNTFQVVTIVKVYTEENDSCIVFLVWLTFVCSSTCININTSKLELVSTYRTMLKIWYSVKWFGSLFINEMGRIMFESQSFFSPGHYYYWIIK